MEGDSRHKLVPYVEPYHELLKASLREGFSIFTVMGHERYLLLGKGNIRRVYDNVRGTLTPDYDISKGFQAEPYDRELEKRASEMTPRFRGRRSPSSHSR